MRLQFSVLPRGLSPGRRHDYTPEQHVAHVVVVTEGVLGPEDGTLTRTMKLRRQQVCDKYTHHVAALLGQLRG